MRAQRATEVHAAGFVHYQQRKVCMRGRDTYRYCAEGLWKGGGNGVMN